MEHSIYSGWHRQLTFALENRLRAHPYRLNGKKSIRRECFPEYKVDIRIPTWSSRLAGALVRCRDCNVNFHLFPESEVDFSTTLAKTEAHFATSRHKLRANKRITLEREEVLEMQKPPQRKKRPTPRSCLDELISNLRHKYPTHAFQVREVPRSLELKVICVKCPKFVYKLFAEGDITIASTVLDSHMKMHASQKAQKA